MSRIYKTITALMCTLVLTENLSSGQDNVSKPDKRWELVLQGWKNLLPDNSHFRANALVETSPGITSSFELEIYSDGSCFLLDRREDGKTTYIDADNPSYSMVLSRMPGQSKYSILKVNKNASACPRSEDKRIQATYGAASGLLAIPILWKPLAWLSDPEHVDITDWKDDGQFTNIAFAVTNASKNQFLFETGTIKLRNADHFAPVEMRLAHPGIELGEEEVKKMIERGIKDANNQPITMDIVGRSDDMSALFQWSFLKDEDGLRCNRLDISGNMYSKMTIELLRGKEKLDRERCQLRHYGIPEPSELSPSFLSRNWIWLVTVVVGTALTLIGLQIHARSRGRV